MVFLIKMKISQVLLSHKAINLKTALSIIMLAELYFAFVYFRHVLMALLESLQQGPFIYKGKFLVHS